jgi:hypothetical protein
MIIADRGWAPIYLGPGIILGKIKIYAEQALQFKAGMIFQESFDNPKTISACVFNPSQIGEYTEGFGNVKNYYQITFN